MGCLVRSALLLDKRGSTLAGHFHSKRAQEGLLYSVMRHVSNQLAKLSGENGTKKCYDPYLAEKDITSCCGALIEGTSIIRAINLSAKEDRVLALLEECRQLDPQNPEVQRLEVMFSSWHV